MKFDVPAIGRPQHERSLDGLVEEVKAGFEILKSLNLRRRGVTVISCPSCARQQFEVIKTVERLEERLAHITTPLTVSVIGCVVNGPGEARETDIGFTGGGNGTHQVYISGVTDHRLKNADIVGHLVELVEKRPQKSRPRSRGRGSPGSQQRNNGQEIHYRMFADPARLATFSSVRPVTLLSVI
jgi:hypothetical protein